MDSCNRRDRVNYLHLCSSSNTSNLFPLHAQSIPFFPIVMIKDLTLGDLNLVSIRNVALNQSIEIKIYLSFRIDARISSSPVTNR